MPPLNFLKGNVVFYQLSFSPFDLGQYVQNLAL